MACTRGCVGTPICSALDICCIQFRADCGSGCGGLAEGYSRVQILANGNLEICSNVGGVCDCCAPPCEIVVPDTCDDGGVGDDYMLRTFDLVDGVLTVGGAPEHYSVSDNLREFSGARTDIGLPSEPGVTRGTHNTQPCVTIVNPSLCREMNVHLVGEADVRDYDWTITPGQAEEWAVNLVIVRQSDLANLSFGRSSSSEMHTSALPGDDYMALNATTLTTDTIPIGGIETYCLEVESVITESHSFVDSTVNASISVMGVTT